MSRSWRQGRRRASSNSSRAPRCTSTIAPLAEEWVPERSSGVEYSSLTNSGAQSSNDWQRRYHLCSGWFRVSNCKVHLHAPKMFQWTHDRCGVPIDPIGVSLPGDAEKVVLVDRGMKSEWMWSPPTRLHRWRRTEHAHAHGRGSRESSALFLARRDHQDHETRSPSTARRLPPTLRLSVGQSDTHAQSSNMTMAARVPVVSAFSSRARDTDSIVGQGSETSVSAVKHSFPSVGDE